MLNFLRRAITSTIALFVFVVACAVGGQHLMAMEPSVQEGSQSKVTPSTQEKPAEMKSTDDGKKEMAEAAAPIAVKVADGSIQFSATGEWKSVPPRSRILEAELQIPRVGEDQQDGRLTIMGAGGTIEANIARWQGQFAQPDGSNTPANNELMNIAGQSVNLVDISGTFMDAPGGPFSGRPKVERKNYRMLAAIIQTKELGNYFVKLYGPKATIDQNAESFKAMIKSLKVTEK